ncbi:MAG: ABC transporter permease subunit [Lachnospiraceae bacterium]|nr:ABC transporter permease subunit [Lachnospiraceae bacterium]
MMKRLTNIFTELGKNRVLYLMMVPTIIWVAVFCYVPMYGVLIAFKDFSYKKGIWGSPFVGLKNFQFLFQYKDVGRIFFNTIFLNVLFIAAVTTLSIFFALIFAEIKHKVYSRVVQTIAIFPHFVSWTVVAMFLGGIIGGSGTLTHWIIKHGGEDPQFFNNALWWPLILVILKIWQGVGYGTIVYVAVITGLDKEIYEAAKVDGASRLQIILKITLPQLKVTAIMLTLMSIGKIFNGDFGMIYAIVGENSQLYATTDVIDTFVYRALRQLNNLGMSTATSFFQSVIGLIMVYITNAVTKKIEPDAAIF